VRGSDDQLGRDAADARPQLADSHSRRDRASRRLAAARGRYEGFWAQDLVAQLKVLDLANWTTVLGAELLWSVLPLLILLSSLADERIDDDLSRHIGVTGQGVHIVRSLFRNSPTSSVVPILTALLFTLVGTITVVGSIQVLYERAFGQQHRGWRDIPRFVAWLLILLAALAVEGIIAKPVRTATGPVVEGLVRFLASILFFWWTIHFLRDPGQRRRLECPSEPGRRKQARAAPAPIGLEPRRRGTDFRRTVDPDDADGRSRPQHASDRAGARSTRRRADRPRTLWNCSGVQATRCATTSTTSSGSTVWFSGRLESAKARTRRRQTAEPMMPASSLPTPGSTKQRPHGTRRAIGSAVLLRDDEPEEQQ
jgi:hypothetical protein